MIEGEITAAYEMALILAIYSASGTKEDLSVIIDTGFSGYLSLPTDVIARLGLTPSGSQTFTLGDNRRVTFPIYQATVVWDGRDRLIRVLATDGPPLIGMRLLYGAVLFADVRDGGRVLVRGF